MTTHYGLGLGIQIASVPRKTPPPVATPTLTSVVAAAVLLDTVIICLAIYH